MEPMTLYFRDALECFKCLFGNPLFSDYMDFIPRREYVDDIRKMVAHVTLVHSRL